MTAPVSMARSLTETPTAPGADRRLSVVAILILAAWIGLFAGGAEVGVFVVRKVVLHRITRLSVDVLWMAPLADVAFLLLVGLALSVVGGSWHRVRSAAVVVSTLVFAAVLMVLLNARFYWWANLLLAGGVAVQTGRLLARRQQGVAGWFGARRPRALAALLFGPVAVIGGLFVGQSAWQGSAEGRRLARLSDADPNAPNVLLIILDTVRSKSLGLYGYERRTTPQLEELARSGVRFDWAMATSPWTLPTHASMFTGRWHHEMSADWYVPLDGALPTLAEALRRHGYVTAGFVANTFYGGYEHGLNRGFLHYEDYRRSPGQILVSSALGRVLGCWNRGGRGCALRPLLGYYDLLGRKNAAVVTRDFVHWLDTRDDERPFFAFLNYFDAHAPYLPPAPFDTLFGTADVRGNPMQLEREDWVWTEEEIAAEQLAYDGAIAFVDDQLGVIFDQLRRRRLFERTVIIVTSDHGEEFGEHGIMSHGNSLYLPSLHVPLLVVFPAAAPRDTSVGAPVSVRDLPATVVDLIGLGDDVSFPGTSLARYWEEPQDNPTESELLWGEVTGAAWRNPSYPVSKGDMTSAVFGRFHYIRSGDGSEELYDFVLDPWETQDLVEREDLAAMLEGLRGAVDSLRRRGEQELP